MLTGIQELKDVQPPFPVPACVLLVQAWPVLRQPPAEGLSGRSWKGRVLDVPLPRFDASSQLHASLVVQARACAVVVAYYVVAYYIAQQRLATQEYNVGKVRLYLRQTLLRSELTAIDAVLIKVLNL